MQRLRCFVLPVLLCLLALLLPCGVMAHMPHDERNASVLRQYAVGRLPADSGPDDFGYTWNDSAPFNWVDATTGTNSGLTGDDRSLGPIDIGFGFRFYENVYTGLYISTNGMLTFGQPSVDYEGEPIPMPAPPNNLIAVLWGDLCVNDNGCNTGAIYYAYGGSAPNRYFTVQWDAVSQLGGTETMTFEVILHENGDIVLQYLTVSARPGKSIVGIEDSTGLGGLAYDTGRLHDNLAVRFSRPAPRARVNAWPVYQGRFVYAGEEAVFQQRIRNTGELGTDIYELTAASSWPVALYAPDGATLLTDTNGDGNVDTGPVEESAFITLTIKVTAPTQAAAGNADCAVVTIRSSLDAARQKMVTLQAAVPARFAQAFQDNADGALSLDIVQPRGQVVRCFSPPNYGGEGLAVTEAPNHNLIFVWSRGRWLANGAYVREIEYAVLDQHGDTVRPIRKLTDHTSATENVYDCEPVLASASGGQIGVLWVRQLYDSTGRELDNVYFAILDAGGNLTYGPADVSGNKAWGTWGDFNVPWFREPAIATTTDSHFVLAWTREHRIQPGSECARDCFVTDVYYAVRGADGSVLNGVRKLTTDTPGVQDSHSRPNLAALSGNRVLLTWTRGGEYADVYAAVLNSAGEIVKAAVNLVSDGNTVLDSGTDAAQLSDGRIIVAWTTGSHIRFTVLDASCNRIVIPTMLENPATVLGNAALSVAQAGNQAVLTWKDGNSDYAPNLYYALLDSNGTPFTRPMIFRASMASIPRLLINTRGYGNSPYSAPEPTPTHTPFLSATPTLPGFTPSPSWSPTPVSSPSQTATTMPSPTETPTATLMLAPTGTPSLMPSTYVIYLPLVVKNLRPGTWSDAGQMARPSVGQAF